MKILKIKKKYENVWYDITMDHGYFDKRERRMYIVEMSEKELMKYFVDKNEELNKSKGDGK